MKQDVENGTGLVFQNGKNYALERVTFTVYLDYTAMNPDLRKALVPES